VPEYEFDLGWLIIPGKGFWLFYLTSDHSLTIFGVDNLSHHAQSHSHSCYIFSPNYFITVPTVKANDCISFFSITVLYCGFWYFRLLNSLFVEFARYSFVSQVFCLLLFVGILQEANLFCLFKRISRFTFQPLVWQQLITSHSSCLFLSQFSTTIHYH
jgi:hypothetical protein